jgi:hypothetical protein
MVRDLDASILSARHELKTRPSVRGRGQLVSVDGDQYYEYVFSAKAKELADVAYEMALRICRKYEKSEPLFASRYALVAADLALNFELPVEKSDKAAKTAFNIYYENGLNVLASWVANTHWLGVGRDSRLAAFAELVEFREPKLYRQTWSGRQPELFRLLGTDSGARVLNALRLAGESGEGKEEVALAARVIFFAYYNANLKGEAAAVAKAHWADDSDPGLKTAARDT